MSSTATFTPAPVRPASHAAGAPICRTLRSSEALTRPSSHTFRAPPSRIARHAEPSVAAATALASMTGSSAFVPAIAVRTAPGRWPTITGTGRPRTPYPASASAVTSKSRSSSPPSRIGPSASSGTTYRCPFRSYTENTSASRPGAGSTPPPSTTRSPVMSVISWSDNGVAPATATCAVASATSAATARAPTFPTGFT